MCVSVKIADFVLEFEMKIDEFGVWNKIEHIGSLKKWPKPVLNPDIYKCAMNKWNFPQKSREEVSIYILPGG